MKKKKKNVFVIILGCTWGIQAWRLRAGWVYMVEEVSTF